ncbi:MAG: leucine-rich repeat domain-containing protein [Spirochaetales bacterium]|nr:leucine-rich repeat domain-containing protein [Spirochaetales bacterium]
METPSPQGIETLSRSVEALLTTEHLQALTRSIIEAHRCGNASALLQQAARAGIGLEQPNPEPRRLFYQLVQLVHPDRLPGLQKTFRDAEGKKDAAELGRLKDLLSIPLEAPARQSRTGDEDTEVWEYPHREESSWEPDGWDDEESRWEETEEVSFLEAVKMDLVGNTDLYISPFEFSQLDGTVDVSGYRLYDLDGAEFFTHITVLDASWNELTDVRELASLDRLIELYLSGNSIDDISPLAGLESLEVLDLEGNEVDDLVPLLELPSLRFVNLRGNPVKDRAVLRSLKEAGVVVLV